mmetsp:Transcript_9951/g.17757  ORF Transcript_9951/g.17757 Transcript_9951/m.17757 type:complete len:206 (+) Transcript_9951:202-819(+)
MPRSPFRYRGTAHEYGKYGKMLRWRVIELKYDHLHSPKKIVRLLRAGGGRVMPLRTVERVLQLFRDTGDVRLPCRGRRRRLAVIKGACGSSLRALWRMTRPSFCLRCASACASILVRPLRSAPSAPRSVGTDTHGRNFTCSPCVATRPRRRHGQRLCKCTQRITSSLLTRAARNPSRCTAAVGEAGVGSECLCTRTLSAVQASRP